MGVKERDVSVLALQNAVDKRNWRIADPEGRPEAADEFETCPSLGGEV
jgi:hypothetical protein